MEFDKMKSNYVVRETPKTVHDAQKLKFGAGYIPYVLTKKTMNKNIAIEKREFEVRSLLRP
jgi:hypothetical protein